jgi:hypothetical protein
MQIAHSDKTRLPSIKTEWEEPESYGEELAGCMLYETPHKDDPDFYQPMPIKCIGDMLECQDMYVFGTTLEDITQELELRHPAPAGLSYVYYCEEIKYRVKETDSWRSREWKWLEDGEGWLILDKPYCYPSNINDLLHLWGGYGKGIFIPNWKLSEDELNYAGFTVSVRRNDLYFVNYNPTSVANKPIRRQQAEVKKRLRGTFDSEHVTDLYHAIKPRFYADLAFGRVINSAELDKARPEDIVDALAAAKKFGYEKDYWRSYSDWRSCNVNHTVTDCLKYVHGVEDECKKTEVKALEEGRRDYLGWLEGYLHIMFPNDCNHDEEDQAPAPVLSFEEYLKTRCYHDQLERCKKIQRFCRWLRRTAKTLDIAIPSRPKMPKLHAKKKKKRRKKSKTKKPTKPITNGERTGKVINFT